MHRKVAQPPHLPKILRSGAFCALRQRSRTMCELLLKAEESWRLNALSEAANAGFWLAHLVSRYLCCRLISYKMNNLLIINIFSLRCEFEWQSRLLLIGQKDKVIVFFFNRIFLASWSIGGEVALGAYSRDTKRGYGGKLFI